MIIALLHMPVMGTAVRFGMQIVKTYDHSTDSTKTLDTLLCTYMLSFYTLQWAVAGFSLEYTLRKQPTPCSWHSLTCSLALSYCLSISLHACL